MRFVMGGPAMALALFATTAAWAADKKGEAFPPVPDAEAIIQQCNNISEELRATPNTSAINAGHGLRTRCLIDNIQENLAILTGEDHIDIGSGGKRIRQTLPAFFEALTKTLDDFYSEVHYGPKSCSPRCGSMASNLVLSDIVNIYEEMLRDVLASRRSRRS